MARIKQKSNRGSTFVKQVQLFKCHRVGQTLQISNYQGRENLRSIYVSLPPPKIRHAHWSVPCFYFWAEKERFLAPAPQFAKRTAAQITQRSRVGKLAFQRGKQSCSASVAIYRNKAHSARKSQTFGARREYSSNIFAHLPHASRTALSAPHPFSDSIRLAYLPAFIDTFCKKPQRKIFYFLPYL